MTFKVTSIRVMQYFRVAKCLFETLFCFDLLRLNVPEKRSQSIAVHNRSCFFDRCLANSLTSIQSFPSLV